jgi:hypothetical protein
MVLAVTGTDPGEGMQIQSHEAQQYTGVDLLDEVYDLIRDRLGRLDADDPMRAELQSILARLGLGLGRSALQAVPGRH